MAIKLSEWAKKNGLTYATCYRWHKEGTMPAKSYTTATGTIFVEDDKKDGITSIELFLRQVVKFTSENKSIVEFSAFVLDNFNLSMKNSNNTINTSQAPSEAKIDIQNHINSFVDSVMPNDEKRRIKLMKDAIKSKSIEVSVDENLKSMIIKDPLNTEANEEDIKALEEIKEYKFNEDK